MKKFLYILLIIPYLLSSHRVVASSGKDKKLCFFKTELELLFISETQLFLLDSDYVNDMRTFGALQSAKHRYVWDGERWKQWDFRVEGAKRYTRSEVEGILTPSDKQYFREEDQKAFRKLQKEWIDPSKETILTFINNKEAKYVTKEEFFGQASEAAAIAQPKPWNKTLGRFSKSSKHPKATLDREDQKRESALHMSAIQNEETIPSYTGTSVAYQVELDGSSAASLSNLDSDDPSQNAPNTSKEEDHHQQEDIEPLDPPVDTGANPWTRMSHKAKQGIACGVVALGHVIYANMTSRTKKEKVKEEEKKKN